MRLGQHFESTALKGITDQSFALNRIECSFDSSPLRETFANSPSLRSRLTSVSTPVEPIQRVGAITSHFRQFGNGFFVVPLTFPTSRESSPSEEIFAKRAVIPANAGTQRKDSATDLATLLGRRFVGFGI